jgi:pSer/pThr/pTyr-binding forkhead associated (FHA) protein/carbon monoxide dehydrogenase subunit G
VSRIASTVVIDRSIQDIWPFFTNVDNVPAWQPGIRGAKQATDGDLASGATVDVSSRVGPLPISFRQQVTELDPHRVIELRPVGGDGFTRLEFDGVGAATRLTVTSETHGVRGLLTELLGLSRPERRERFFEDLKHLVEERTPRVADVAPPTADETPPEPIADTTPPELIADTPREPVAAKPAPEIAAQAAIPVAPAEPAEPAPVEPASIEENASAMAAPAAEEAPTTAATSGAVAEPATGAPATIGERLVLRLEGTRGPAPTFEVAKSGATIGRGPDNTIRLDDLSVSRRHSRIAYRQGRFWLTDVGSTSGTWVDGTRLNAPRRLMSGQIIDVGLCRLIVDLAAGTDEAATKDEEPTPSEIAGHSRRRR